MHLVHVAFERVDSCVESPDRMAKGVACSVRTRLVSAWAATRSRSTAARRSLRHAGRTDHDRFPLRHRSQGRAYVSRDRVGFPKASTGSLSSPRTRRWAVGIANAKGAPRRGPGRRAG